MHAGILKNAKRMSQVTLAFWGISKLHAGILLVLFENLLTLRFYTCSHVLFC